MTPEERLERLDALIAETRAEREMAVGQIEQLKARGRTKSATFQQLLARKMTLDSFLRALEEHGLA